MLHLKALIILSVLFHGQLFAATWNIIYPQHPSGTESRNEYPVQLLTLALEQTGVKFKIQNTEKVMSQGRSLKRLAANHEVNVVWTMTDDAREAELLPIRIPIYKGLIGWRLFLLDDSSQQDFFAVKTMEQLLKWNPVQGQDWPDTKILRANGFEVLTSAFHLDLFQILSQQHKTFFPRSVVEIWIEKDNIDAARELNVAPRMGLYYPTAAYYFVNKKNTTLARLIETGLELAIENGDFDELFSEYYKPLLDKASMTKRNFIELNNPVLPENTPIGRSELWYNIN